MVAPILPFACLAGLVLATNSSSDFTPRAQYPTTTEIAQWLEAHNVERERHNALPLEWSDDLSLAAGRWTDKCQWRHSRGEVGHYGENLFAGRGYHDVTFVVEFWSAERKDYNASDPKPSHWTQVVWKNTELVGCAKTVCVLPEIPPHTQKKDIDFYACEYYPPGNYRNQYGKNVSK
ncbi:CAP domain-containing protein [Flagelloscypha sp. PMI_526]|nr:CAP domain-containing protein [Flagelloscypha sp. PMI_526]